jgi:hypothetical protein
LRSRAAEAARRLAIFVAVVERRRRRRSRVERNPIRSGGVMDDGSQTRSDEEVRGVAHFQVVEQPDGRYHWQLINPHGTPAARSSESYATEDEAVAAVEQARRLIGEAPIKRPVQG